MVTKLIHGYDDKGSKFDGNGNINNWWDKKDLQNYIEKMKMMTKQTELYKYDLLGHTYKIKTKINNGRKFSRYWWNINCIKGHDKYNTKRKY